MAATRRPSFRNNFAARFTADVYGLVTSLAAATITARALGPSGRGFYASLVLLCVLFVQLFNAGLGEAAVVLPGRGSTDARSAVAATTTVIGPLSIAGAVAFMVTAALVLDPDTSNERLALVLGGVLVLLNTVATTISWFLVSRERLVAIAVLTMISATLSTLALFLLVGVADLGIAGAIVAAILGCLLLLVPMSALIRREGISLKPSWDGAYLRSAARFGMAVQVSNLLVQMTGRLDLILVYRILDSAAAGRYSIGLTIGTLVGSVPTAIAFASFPRLPTLSNAEAQALTTQLFRIGVSSAIACGAVLAVATPVLLTLVFGDDYRGAIGPTMVLIPGGILWSGQWILGRAAAARNDTKPLVVSFSASFVSMILLDVALVEPFGVMGAAAASLIASAVGFVIALLYYRRSGWRFRDLVPRFADLRAMLTVVAQMLRALRRRPAEDDSLRVPLSP
jgi:O-antigen/teichoic acid export membrane protein